MILSKMNYWDNEKVLSLIDEYKNRPILWKKTDKHFHKVLEKEDAWNEMSKIFSVDKETLKRKIESLRGSRRREKNRILKSKRNNGNRGRKGVYVPRWFAWHRMRFLDESDGVDNQIEEISDVELNSNVKQETFERVNLIEESHLKDDTVHKSSARTTNSKKRILPSRNTALKRRHIDNTCIQKSYNRTDNDKKDECALFGAYIAEKLRKFEDRARAILQNQIHNFLFEAEIGRSRIDVQIPSTSQTTNHFNSSSSPSPIASDRFKPIQSHQEIIEELENSNHSQE